MVSTGNSVRQKTWHISTTGALNSSSNRRLWSWSTVLLRRSMISKNVFLEIVTAVVLNTTDTTSEQLSSMPAHMALVIGQIGGGVLADVASVSFNGHRAGGSASKSVSSHPHHVIALCTWWPPQHTWKKTKQPTLLPTSQQSHVQLSQSKQQRVQIKPRQTNSFLMTISYTCSQPDTNTALLVCL